MSSSGSYVHHPPALTPNVSPKLISFERHPQTDLIVSKVQGYFLEHYDWPSVHEREIYAKQDVETWIPMVCPSAPEDRAELACAYITFLWLYDDLLEEMNPSEAQHLVKRLITILSDKFVSSPMSSLEIIAEDICTRIRGVGDQVSRQLASLFLKKTCEYLESVSNKTDRARSMSQGLEAYLDYRIVDAGFWFTVDLLLWELDIVVPDHILQDSTVKRFTKLAGSHELLVNDILSYPLERQLFLEKQAREGGSLDPSEGYVLYNVICVLLNQDGVTPSTVMDSAQEHLAAIEEKVEKASQDVRERFSLESSNKHVAQRYVDVIWMLIRGNAGWSMRCGRYRGEWPSN